MSDFISWLKENPTALTSLSTALISASVALIVAVITQWTLSRRGNRDLLTKKLEELYLLINQAAVDNADKGIILRNALENRTGLKGEEINQMHIRMGNSYKQANMYISLYFPLLNETHRKLFVAQADLHSLIDKLNTKSPPKFEEFKTILDKIGELFAKIETEIIENRKILVGVRSSLKRYKRAT